MRQAVRRGALDRIWTTSRSVRPNRRAFCRARSTVCRGLDPRRGRAARPSHAAASIARGPETGPHAPAVRGVAGRRPASGPRGGSPGPARCPSGRTRRPRRVAGPRPGSATMMRSALLFTPTVVMAEPSGRAPPGTRPSCSTRYPSSTRSAFSECAPLDAAHLLRHDTSHSSRVETPFRYRLFRAGWATPAARDRLRGRPRRGGAADVDPQPVAHGARPPPSEGRGRSSPQGRVSEDDGVGRGTGM